MPSEEQSKKGENAEAKYEWMLFIVLATGNKFVCLVFIFKRAKQFFLYKENTYLHNHYFCNV